MPENRREFFHGVAALAAMGLADPRAIRETAMVPPAADSPWDMSWRERVNGTFRAVFDSPHPSDGDGIWRAADWQRTVRQVFAAPASDVSSVLVLRHEAIPLVMNGAFWERHDISKKQKIHDPLTGKTVRTNPFAGGPDTPKQMQGFTIGGFQQAGGIILACNYAFGQMVYLESKKAKVPFAEARAQTLPYLLPGVILQPSGFFAVLEAERVGCRFFPAS